ncbi:MAG: LPS export ABC transporter periplasmic protein LptC [bacterium]|nr:LPS export ABC transporter periplasmic protein LptC [bacterium]
MRRMTTLVLSALMVCVNGMGNATTDAAPRQAASEVLDAFMMRDDVRMTEIDESGRKLWEVRGVSAESQSADVVRIYKVEATLITERGEQVKMYTESADVNRRTREIVTECHVDIISGDRVLSGTGMRINHAKHEFDLFKDVQIVAFRQAGDVTLESIR